MCGVVLLLVLIGLILSIYLTVSFIGVILTLIIAGLVGWLAWWFFPIKLPYGFPGAVVAGLIGSWIGGWLLGDIGPELGGIAIFPALVGSLLLAAGTKGKRNGLPHGRIMIHQPLAGMEGTASDILIHAEEFIRMKKQLNQIYQKHTGQTLERLEEDTDRDRFMGPQEAHEYGLIDKILDREPKMALSPNAL